MRIVALEEHFIVRALAEPRFGLSAPLGLATVPNPGIGSSDRLAQLDDLGDRRLAAMNEAGITMQVLSATFPGADLLDGEEGVSFARRTNDRLANAVAAHPDRYAGFAHLPMRVPTAAAEELERTVRTLGFRGALINGTTDGLFLDNPRFQPVLEMATSLDVPIYLHPCMPPKAVFEAYFEGLPGNAGPLLAGGAYGWHSETGLHVLRLAAAGVLDAYPSLKLIIGHMGETLPFMIERTADVFHRYKVMDRHLMEVIREHLYLTTSGFFTLPPFLNALLVFGIDRLMFSVDYPYADNVRARTFLDSLPISTLDREKLAHRNVDALLGLADVTE